jgi:X-domain of DnaJ-containing
MVRAGNSLVDLVDDSWSQNTERTVTVNRAQQRQLEKLQAEREEVRTKRIAILTERFIRRMQFFMQSDHTSISNTIFIEVRSYEAEFLALECFGVDLLHTIGLIYIQKANECLRDGKFRGLGGVWFKKKEQGRDLMKNIGIGTNATNSPMPVEGMSEIDEERVRKWAEEQLSSTENYDHCMSSSGNTDCR